MHARRLALALVLCSVLSGCRRDSSNSAVAQPGPQTGPGPGVSEVALFVADRERTGTHQLYFARVDGTEALLLSLPLPLGHTIGRYALSPDRTVAAYSAGDPNGGTFGIHLVDMSNGAVATLGVQSVGGPDDALFCWAQDSSRLAMSIANTGMGRRDVHTVQRDGTGLTVITSPLSETRGFHWSPDSRWLAVTGTTVPAGPRMLFLASPDGQVLVDATGGVIADSELEDCRFAPDSSAIAFVLDAAVEDEFQLFANSAPPGGRTPVSPTRPGGPDIDDFAWSPDSAYLVYQADLDENGQNDLWGTTPSGVHRRVSRDFPSSHSVSSFAWSPDSTLIAYRVQDLVSGGTELHVTDVDGNWALASATGPSTADVKEIFWSPDSRRIAYRHDLLLDNVHSLYVWDRQAPSLPQRLTDPLADGAVAAQTISWSPDSRRIVYGLSRPGTTGLALQLREIANPVAAILLSQRLFRTGGWTICRDIQAVEWSPNSERLVFMAGNGLANRLYSAPGDGSGPAIEISGTFTGTGRVRDFEFYPVRWDG